MKYLSHSLKAKYNLKRGDRVLLVFFPGLDFTVSLLACFMVGLIAVPVILLTSVDAFHACVGEDGTTTTD